MNAMFRRLMLALLFALGMVGTLCAQDWSKVRIHTIPLGENLHVLAGGGGNVILSTGEDGLLLVDSSYAELAEKLQAAVKAVSDKPVRLVINTHWHFDHVGGNESLAKAGAIIIAHENVRKCMSEERFLTVIDRKTDPSPAGALPKVTFSESLTFHWNGDDVNVLHVAAGHTDGDSIVHFRKANVLHMGDTWFNGMYPFMDVNAGGSVDGFVRTIDKALSLADEKTRIVPGHGRVSNAAELKHYREMLVASRDRIQALVKAGQSRENVIAAKPMKDFDVEFGGSWLTPQDWVGLVYDSMTRDRASSPKAVPTESPADKPSPEKVDRPDASATGK